MFSILSKILFLIKKHMKNNCRSQSRGDIRLGGRSMTSRRIGSHSPCCGRWRLQLCSGRCNRINWIVVVVSGNVVNFVNISLWWKIAEAVRGSESVKCNVSKKNVMSSIPILAQFPPCINILLKFLYVLLFFVGMTKKINKIKKNRWTKKKKSCKMLSRNNCKRRKKFDSQMTC